jgi:hypothetical protein
VQLERDRAAVQQTRSLLAMWPAVKRELRQLLWSIDDGQAVGVAGVPDPDLRAAMEALLTCLGLKTAQVPPHHGPPACNRRPSLHGAAARRRAARGGGGQPARGSVAARPAGQHCCCCGRTDARPPPLPPPPHPAGPVLAAQRRPRHPGCGRVRV